MRCSGRTSLAEPQYTDPKVANRQKVEVSWHHCGGGVTAALYYKAYSGFLGIYLEKTAGIIAESAAVSRLTGSGAAAASSTAPVTGCTGLPNSEWLQVAVQEGPWQTSAPYLGPETARDALSPAKHAASPGGTTCAIQGQTVQSQGASSCGGVQLSRWHVHHAGLLASM